MDIFSPHPVYMSDPAPVQTPPPAVPAEPAAKPKIKRNISDEERARRSARMKEISAKRLAEVRAKKPQETPKSPEPVAAEPVVAKKEKKVAPETSDDEDIVEKIIQRLATKTKKAPKAKKVVEPESSEDEDIVKPEPKKTTAKPPPKTKSTPKPKPEARQASPPRAPEPPPSKRTVRFF